MMIKKCTINFNEMQPVELFDLIVEDSDNLVIGDYPHLSIANGAISVKPLKNPTGNRGYNFTGNHGIIRTASIPQGMITLWQDLSTKEYILELETRAGEYWYYQMQCNRFISVETE